MLVVVNCEKDTGNPLEIIEKPAKARFFDNFCGSCVGLRFEIIEKPAKARFFDNFSGNWIRIEV